MKFMNLTVALSISAAFLISGCSTKDEYLLFNQKKNNTLQPATSSMDYSVYESKIIPNNRLSILVFNHPELSTRDVRAQIDPNTERGVLVARDGTVDLPLIGVIRLSGLTTREAATLLTREYSKYVKHAHVTVDILNKRAFVMGEVRNPGRVDIVEDTSSLLELISTRGGLTDYADRQTIRIIRGTRTKPEVETVDLTKLSSLTPNALTIYPNDVVYVEPNEYRRRNLGIAESMPGLEIADRVLNILFNGKQLTNTRLFDIRH
jgi:polysaccharide export outer membrane protein